MLKTQALDLRSLQQTSVSPEHFIARLRTSVPNWVRQKLPNQLRADAVGTLAVRDIEHVVAQVITTEFGRQFSTDFIPMGSEGASPWAKDIVYKRVTSIGLAQWVNSADMPWADVESVETKRRVHTMGAKTGWSLMELMESQGGGVPLDASQLEATKMSVDASRDIVMLSGDGALPGQSGLVKTGLINDAQVPRLAANGTFSARTNDEIIADVLSYLREYADNNKQNYRAATMLLPSDQYFQLMQPRASGTDTSVASYLIANTTLTGIEELPQLAGAGAGGVDRAILYIQDPKILIGLMILGFRTIDPQQHDLMTTVSAIERQAGMAVKYPPGILYIDGI
ncbi:MAG: major capsid family protein [Myxococcota bacterium]